MFSRPSIDCFIHKAVSFFIFFTSHVDELMFRKMRDEQIVYLHVLRPERLLLHLVLVPELTHDELTVHTHLYLTPGKPAFLRFSQREYERFILRPIVRLLFSQELFNFRDPLLTVENNNPGTGGPRIISRTTI